MNDYITFLPLFLFPSDCVEWTPWLDFNQPSIVKRDELEHIDSLIAQSTCKNPIEIECRQDSPTRTPAAQSGQNVVCDLQEGLKCLGEDDSVCYNYEVRLGCLKPGPNCREYFFFNLLTILD